MSKGKIAVDLDGTLAHYDQWRGLEHIGDPIPPMIQKVRQAVKDGFQVVIFTARTAPPNDRARAQAIIELWCEKHIGFRLPVTSVKDFSISEFWDDRARQVVPNTGLFLEETLTAEKTL